MKTRGYLAFVAAFVLAFGAVAASQAANTKVTIGPNAAPAATATPKANALFKAVPIVSPQPACTAGLAGEYADANGCIYLCSGGKVSIDARSLSNTCAYPTTGPTASPTPTATGTTTPTATATA